MQDHELAVIAAEAGARVVRQRFGSVVSRINKVGNDFATDVDLDSERAILDVIRKYRPSDAILAEESGAVGSPRSDRRWLVDPLCGTLNYAAGTDPVAVNVALRSDDRVVVAAVADPLLDEILWTDGSRTYLRRDRSDRVAVPDAVSQLVDVNLDQPFPNERRFRAVGLLAAPRSRRGSVRVSFQHRSLSPGLPQEDAPLTLPTVTCATTCTSRRLWMFALPPVVS